MAQQVQNQEDNRIMKFASYITGSETQACWGIVLSTGSGNYKFLHGTCAGKREAALACISTMIETYVKARNLEIKLTTNSAWLVEALGEHGYKAMNNVERISQYGKSVMDQFSRMIGVMKNLGDRLAIDPTPDEFGLDLARAAAYYELHQIKAAQEAAAIASSEEELTAQEA